MQNTQTDHADRIKKKLLIISMSVPLLAGCFAFGTYAEEGCRHQETRVAVENEVMPGCTTAGSYDEVIYCGICGAELGRETKENPATGHVPMTLVQENLNHASCTRAGSHDEVVYCQVCGTELSRVTVTDEAAAGHFPGDRVRENEIPSTCSTAGSHDEVIYCQVCGAELSRVTVNDPLSEHVPADRVSENEVPSTCAAAGSHDEVIYCLNCSAELSRVTVEDALTDHIPAEAVRENEIPASDTAAGSHDEVVYCQVCGAQLSRITVEDIPDPAAEELLYSGECGIEGDNLKWFLDQDGRLCIYGTGVMADYQDPEIENSIKAPWYNVRTEIKTIEIAEELTVIGDYAFKGCEFLETINIPSSVTGIGEYAFYDWNALTTVNYAGSDLQWKTIIIEENNPVLDFVPVHFKENESPDGNLGGGNDLPDGNPGGGNDLPDEDLGGMYGSNDNGMTGSFVGGQSGSLNDITNGNLTDGLNGTEIAGRNNDLDDKDLKDLIPVFGTGADPEADKESGSQMGDGKEKELSELTGDKDKDEEDSELTGDKDRDEEDSEDTGDKDEENPEKENGQDKDTEKSGDEDEKTDDEDDQSTGAYTVTFDANGHDYSAEAQKVAEGEKAVMPDPFFDEGFCLTGWFCEAECVNEWNFETDKVTEDITLYANWQKAAVLASDLIFNDEEQYLIISAQSGIWIRIEDEEGEDGGNGWILVEENTEGRSGLKRMDAGSYQLYCYYGSGEPAADESGYYLGQVDIAKADAVVTRAPEANTAANAQASAEADAEDNADAGADTQAGAEADSEDNADAGADEQAGAGADSEDNADTGAGAQAGTGADSGLNSDAGTDA